MIIYVYRLQKEERKRREKTTMALNRYINNTPSSTCKVQLRISLCLESDSQSIFAVGRGMAGGSARSDDVVSRKGCQVLIFACEMSRPAATNDHQTDIEIYIIE